MDINNLKAFIAVADKKSFSRSAEQLQLTQPAVSKRIAALEQELSAKLFDRVGRSVHLTEAGRVLLPSAKQISAELSRIEDVICNLGAEVGGTLSIGTTEHVGTHRLPQVLKPFRELHPKVDVDLTFANTQRSLAAVEEGVLEIAICSLPTGSSKLHSKLRDIDIWRDKLLIVAASDHPLVQSEPVPLELLVKCPAILQPPEAATRKMIDTILSESNLRADVSIEAQDFDTISSMASIGLGWACLPEFQMNDSLAVIDVAEINLTQTISLVRHQDRSLSRAAQAFLDLLPAQAA